MCFACKPLFWILVIRNYVWSPQSLSPFSSKEIGISIHVPGVFWNWEGKNKACETRRRQNYQVFLPLKQLSVVTKWLFIILPRLKFDSFCRYCNYLLRKLHNCIYNFYNIIDWKRIIRDQLSWEMSYEHSLSWTQPQANFCVHVSV